MHVQRSVLNLYEPGYVVLSSFAWYIIDRERTFDKTCKDQKAKSELNKRLGKITWYLLLTYRGQKVIARRDQKIVNQG